MNHPKTKLPLVVTASSIGASLERAVQADDLEKVALSSEDAEALNAFRLGVGRGLQKLEDEQQDPDVMITPEHTFASLIQSYLASKAGEEGLEAGDLGPGGREVKFDNHDIGGWAASFFTWWRKLRPHPFIAGSDDVDPLPTDARLAILGDWGSGLYGAPECAKSIDAHPDEVHAAIHLGDIYYSGTSDECVERFLEPWPKRSGLVSRACNANHEMYTGGNGYFGKVLPSIGQRASLFALANDNWLFLGLDSAYVDGRFGGEGQIDWIRKRIAEREGRRVILFCHHQPFSPFEQGNKHLLTALKPNLEAREIFAWYWGHEHQCIIFDRHEDYRMYGRCIGHGGFPWFRKDSLTNLPRTNEPPIDDQVWRTTPGEARLIPSGRALDGPNRYVTGKEHRYGPNGYLMIELDGASLHETVHAPDGTTLLSQELP